LRVSRFGSDLHGGLWDREIRARGRAVHQPFEEIRLNVMSYEGDVIQYYTILDAQHVIINRQVLAFGDWIKFRQVTCTYHSIKVNRTEPFPPHMHVLGSRRVIQNYIKLSVDRV
jgi:hypothetical protein